MSESVPVRVRHGDGAETISVERGRILRDALREAGFEVYGPAARVANCGGRGLCATCGVRVHEGLDEAGDEPAADHWHDALAARFGYPRLSCQLTVERPLTVDLIQEGYWGQLLPRRD
ncbi:2Fe-2S iron-sulfur cluster-binding protein [Halosegnis sp.]|uniref:2Fe-2S iron-sulfur cluster-binding protein n=1 Tax=Halosegnis sp. TaxID=2864959 RepID=UPI0035D48EB8